VVKTELTGEIVVDRLGLIEDEQADPRFHGGPDRALVAYPRPHYERWRSLYPDNELQIPLFGENLSVTALETEVCIGDVYALGSATVQVSQPRTPCRKPQRVWGLPRLAKLMKETGMTGWCFRVLEPGSFSAPAEVHLLDRPNPGQTIASANQPVPP
jgi:MOSC domain-containing protein YiiM